VVPLELRPCLASQRRESRPRLRVRFRGELLASITSSSSSSSRSLCMQNNSHNSPSHMQCTPSVKRPQTTCTAMHTTTPQNFQYNATHWQNKLDCGNYYLLSLPQVATHLFIYLLMQFVPRPIMGLFTFWIEVTTVFSLGCIKTPMNDALKFGTIL